MALCLMFSTNVPMNLRTSHAAIAQNWRNFGQFQSDAKLEITEFDSGGIDGSEGENWECNAIKMRSRVPINQDSNSAKCG